MPTSKELPAPQLVEELQEGPLFQIVLFEDDEHTYGYVVEMLCNLFGMTPQRAYGIAYEVDYCGQAVVKTCPLEEAFRGREAIVHYGADPRLENSRGSMKAIVQEAGE